MPRPGGLQAFREMLNEAMSDPRREKAGKALSSALNRSLGKGAMPNIRTGVPEFPSNTIFDYQDFGADPMAHLSRRDIVLPQTQRGIESILPPYRSPNRMQEILNAANRGASQGGHLWYNTAPIFDFANKYAPEADVHGFLGMGAPFSAQTAVDKEIKQGAFANYFLKKYGQLPTADEMMGVEKGILGGGGSIADKLQWAKDAIEHGGKLQAPETEAGELAGKTKLIPYDEARKGNRWNAVMDTWMLRGLGINPMAAPSKKGGAELGVKLLADRAGMMPSNFQAAAWIGLQGDTRPYAHILDDLVSHSAENLEKNKHEHMADVLSGRDYIRDEPANFAEGGLAQYIRQRLRDEAKNANYAPMRSKLEQWSREPISDPFGVRPSGRKAVALGPDKVVKVVGSWPRGFAEQDLEGDPMLARKGLVPQLYWRSPDSELTVTQRIMNTNEKHQDNFARPMEKAYNMNESGAPYQTRHRDDPALANLMNDRNLSPFFDYDLLGGDFFHPRHWGFQGNYLGPKSSMATLLDTGALEPNLTSMETHRNYLPQMRNVDSLRADFLSKKFPNQSDIFQQNAATMPGQVIFQFPDVDSGNINLRALGQRNPVPKLPGFADGGRAILKLAKAASMLKGQGRMEFESAAVNPKQRALMDNPMVYRDPETGTLVRAGEGYVPAATMADYIKKLDPKVLNRAVSDYMEDATRKLSAQEVKGYVNDPERNAYRLADFYAALNPASQRWGQLGMKVPSVQEMYPDIPGFAGGGVARNFLRGVPGSGIDEVLGGLKSRFHQEIGDQGQRNVAMKQWIDRNLGNYMVRQLGTEDDPLHEVLRGTNYLADRQGAPINLTRRMPAAHVPERLGWGPGLLNEKGAVEDTRLQETQENRPVPGWIKSLIEQDTPRNDKARAILTAKAAALDKSPYGGGRNAVNRASNEYAQAQQANSGNYKFEGLPDPVWLHDIDPHNWDRYMRGPMQQMMDYLSQNYTSEQLPKISVPDAMRGSIAWHEALAKKKAEMMKDPFAGTTVHKEYPTGYKWVKFDPTPAQDELASNLKGRGHEPRNDLLEEALKKEGEAMGHCVGGYCDDVISGQSQIYSLRDPQGQPHVTVEVNPNSETGITSGTALEGRHGDEMRGLAEGWRALKGPRVSFHQFVENNSPGATARALADLPSDIAQIKGKGNKKPADQYLPYVQDFVRSGKWGDVGDLHNTGLIPFTVGKEPQVHYGTHDELGRFPLPEGYKESMKGGTPIRLSDDELQGWRPGPIGFAEGGPVKKPDPQPGGMTGTRGHDEEAAEWLLGHLAEEAFS